MIGFFWLSAWDKRRTVKGYNVNPGLINPVYGCFIGGDTIKKYQIMTIGGIAPNYPYAPCMEYLPTFTPKTNQM